MSVLIIVVIAVALHQFCGTEKGCSCGSCLGCRMAEVRGNCSVEQDEARRAFDWHRYEFLKAVRLGLPGLGLEGVKRAEDLVNAYKQVHGEKPSPTPWP